MAVESVFNLPYTPPWALKNLKTLPFSKNFPVKLFLFQNFSVKTLPFLKFSCKNSSFFIDQTSKIFLFENFSWWIGKLFLFSNEFGPSAQILPVGYPTYPTYVSTAMLQPPALDLFWSPPRPNYTYKNSENNAPTPIFHVESIFDGFRRIGTR